MNLNTYIDHTLLKPEAEYTHIEKLCDEAMKHHFFAVCVNSSHVSLCHKILKGTSVQLASVVGFPLGAMDTKSKAFETHEAIKNGATEIDMVIPVGHLKSGDSAYVENDIKEVVKAAQGFKVKVILETSLLNDDQKKLVCQLSLNAGAHFVKTSTGFGGGGATLEDIRLMKSMVGSHMEIKASGGIKTFEFAKNLIAAGAARLGTSSGVALVTHQDIPKDGY